MMADSLSSRWRSRASRPASVMASSFMTSRRQRRGDSELTCHRPRCSLAILAGWTAGVIPTTILGAMPAKDSAAEAGLPIDAPERRRLPPLLRRAWYGLNQAFRRRITHLGITPDQFTVMRTLLEGEGISQRRLTELMSSDPNTVASLL